LDTPPAFFIDYGTQGIKVIRILGQKITVGRELCVTGRSRNKKAPETGASKRVQEYAL
jgi:hypothetical protein